MAASSAEDAFTAPPELLKTLYKRWQRAQPSEFTPENGLLDTVQMAGQDVPGLSLRECEGHTRIQDAFETFRSTHEHDPVSSGSAMLCYEIDALPGLFLYPRMFPASIQTTLLDRLLHRDAIHPEHKTNLHLFYDMSPLLPPVRSDQPQPESQSLFAADANRKIYPFDPQMHKPLSVAQVANRKLRWTTLGGQYDWTAKKYPQGKPPPFPPDVGELLRAAFPQVDPQAAILNFYSPGDTLSLHRDVSEDCDRDLISISIGCDCVFIAASGEGLRSTALRLRSGDALLMSGESRFAWHGVPKVIKDTCPAELKGWPAQHNSDAYATWKNWLANKRINLNVRQMRAGPDASHGRVQ